MANVYIKGVEGGENTNPDGTEAIEIDNGVISEWVQINNLFDGAPSQGDVIYFNGTKWARASAGTDGQVWTTGGAGANPAWEDAAGGGLTNSIASVTTANVTGVAGTRHVLDVSGMTANRNFVLPSTGSVGDEIEVNLSVGDDTYALILIGDTGVTITARNVTTATATEWSRIFIKGETVRFVKTTSTNWNVTSDGRVPCVGIIERQAAQSINSSSTTKIAFDTINTNRGDICDVTTNDRINIRRTNIYQVTGFVSISNVLDNQEFLEADLYKNGSLFKFKRDYVSTASSNLFASPEVVARGTYSAGDYFELYLTHNEGAAQNTDTTYYPTLAVFEVL